MFASKKYYKTIFNDCKIKYTKEHQWDFIYRKPFIEVEKEFGSETVRRRVRYVPDSYKGYPDDRVSFTGYETYGSMYDNDSFWAVPFDR